MSVKLPYFEKLHLTDSLFIDMKIFDRDDQPKFSLTLVDGKKRVICFDNHEQQEPHVHVKNHRSIDRWHEAMLHPFLHGPVVL